MSDEKWLEGDSDPTNNVYEDGDEPAMPEDPVEEDPVREFPLTLISSIKTILFI